MICEELLAEERVRRRGIFDPTAVARLLREELEGTRRHGLRLWTLVAFELWAEVFRV